MTTDADREILADMGQTLYGTRWQSDLARALGVGDRRVREWVNGERSIPPAVWVAMEELLAERWEACRRLTRTAHKRAREELQAAMGL